MRLIFGLPGLAQPGRARSNLRRTEGDGGDRVEVAVLSVVLPGEQRPHGAVERSYFGPLPEV